MPSFGNTVRLCAVLGSLLPILASAQANLPQASLPPPTVASSRLDSMIALREVSTTTLHSEAGGTFILPVKCDGDGNLYVRIPAPERPLLGYVERFTPEGKHASLFNLANFSDLSLERADGFSSTPDGGLFQIAQSGTLHPKIYVLHFASDGSHSLAVHLDADFEVYAFAAFPDGNFLVSGVKRRAMDENDRGHNFTAVFSADGRELAPLNFTRPSDKEANSSAPNANHARAATKPTSGDPGVAAPSLDLSDAEVGSDGLIYVMKNSSPAIVYAISSSGSMARTIKVTSPLPGGKPSAFHVSANRMAISFRSDNSDTGVMVVIDAQTGRLIATYSDPFSFGTTFACYAADEDAFTFLRIDDLNGLQAIRTEP